MLELVVVIVAVLCASDNAYLGGGGMCSVMTRQLFIILIYSCQPYLFVHGHLVKAVIIATLHKPRASLLPSNAI